MDQDKQDTDTQYTGDSSYGSDSLATRPRNYEPIVVALAVIGAIILLPVVAGVLGFVVKLAIGLIAGAVGLVFGMVSLVVGLAFGIVGLALGLIGAVAGFLVTPPGLVLIALVVYLRHRD